MEFIEETRDLFSLPQDYLLVHCISSDRAMGAGIAKVFRDKYDIKTILCNYRDWGRGWNEIDMIGKCVIVRRNEKCPWAVANLITKHNYYDKPTYETLEQSLMSLKRILIEDEAYGFNSFSFNRKLGMPLIGCGLDRLKWDKVSEIIKEVFADTDIEIVVCRR